jgi:membrane-associated phospholipid phosphatase
MGKRRSKTKSQRGRLAARLGRSHGLEGLDLALGAAATKAGRNRVLHPFTFLAELADEPPLLIAALAVAGIGAVRGDKKMRRSGLRMLIALGLAIGAAKLGKQAVARTRPRKLVDKGEHQLFAGGPTTDPWNSFPSGHAAAAFAAARALGRDYPVIAPPSLGAAVSAGSLKVLKGDHFPTDIIAGLAIGYCAEALASSFLPATPSAYSPNGTSPSTPHTGSA